MNEGDFWRGDLVSGDLQGERVSESRMYLDQLLLGRKGEEDSKIILSRLDRLLDMDGAGFTASVSTGVSLLHLAASECGFQARTPNSSRCYLTMEKRLIDTKHLASVVRLPQTGEYQIPEWLGELHCVVTISTSPPGPQAKDRSVLSMQIDFKPDLTFGRARLSESLADTRSEDKKQPPQVKIPEEVALMVLKIAGRRSGNEIFNAGGEPKGRQV